MSQKKFKKNKGKGFINPPYQNGKNELQKPQAAKVDAKVINRKHGNQR